MRTKSEPAVIAIVVAGYILLAAIAVVNGGCAHAAHAAPTTSSTTFDVAATHSVEVNTECGSGTGVLVNSQYVVTAHHVLDCDRRDHKVRLAKDVSIKTIYGDTFAVAFDALDEARDLARLRLAKPLDQFGPLTIAHTAFGEPVCAVTSVPERSVICGFTRPGVDRYYGDIHITGASIWFGNSGSPLFDANGVLVGIVTRLRWCNAIDEMLYKNLGMRVGSCGGNASSIDDSPVMP